MKPILSTSMKYYVRKKDQEAWAPGSQLASRFKLEIQACRRENLYKQFWSERLAEGKMGWDLEDRLVVTEQNLERLMKGMQGSVQERKVQSLVPAAADGGVLSDGRVLPDGRTPRNPGLGLKDGNRKEAVQPEETILPAADEKEIRIVREGGQFKIYQGNVLAADTKTVCENCWNVLPPQLYQSDMKVIHISLVAGVGVGKSCLLLSWLRSVNANLAAPGDQIRIGLNSWPERYLFHSLMWDDLDFPQVYEEMLDRFENRDLCPKKTDPTFVPPVFMEAECMSEEKKGQSVLLCIYDAAGEVLTHFKARNWNPVLMKHLEQTDAVIFLIDPADAGLQTKGMSAKYAYLEQKLRTADISGLFAGGVLEPGEQARAQSNPVASQTLEEILQAKLPEVKGKEEEQRKKNTEAAFLALENFLRHAATVTGASERQIQEMKETLRGKLMAVVVPKSDSFRDHYEQEYPDVFQTYEGNTGMKRENFEKAHMDAVSAFFSDFYNLEEIGARFPNHKEFILSSLGCEARPVRIQEEGGEKDYTRLEGEYRPFRIEDPIHWILNKVLSADGM